MELVPQSMAATRLMKELPNQAPPADEERSKPPRRPRSKPSPSGGREALQATPAHEEQTKPLRRTKSIPSPSGD
ncbi:hypothetical protein GCM10010433_71870 [Streptomyces pulveraceus]